MIGTSTSNFLLSLLIVQIKCDLSVLDNILHKRNERQVQRDLSFKWPDNTIPYFIAANITSDLRVSVSKAMSALETNTCIRFKKIDSSSVKGDAIRIVDLGSCSSLVGRQNMGVQDVSLTEGCWGQGTAQHELMHAIGVEHTQSRSDRNQHLNILYKNIDNSDLPNFELLSSRDWVNLVPYDYGSVMHYSADSFARKSTEETMTPKDKTYIETMGSLIPNFYDYDQINHYYQCYESCVDSDTNCGNGGVPNPNDCSKCICPMGYGGDLCTQRPHGCGGILTASKDWQSKEITASFNRKDTQYYTFCTWWIVAPANSTIEVNYVMSSKKEKDLFCEYGCYDAGIEVKHLSDPRITNERDCCLTSPVGMNTTTNPLPVILYTAARTVTYDFGFRYL